VLVLGSGAVSVNSPTPAPWDRWGTVARRGVVAAVAVGLMAWAFLRWRHSQAVFDDAFISYRYARNLIAGQGLVFNPDERVEGYTNFLWTLIAALGIAVRQDPLSTTRAVGVAAYLCTIVVGVVAASGQICRGRDGLVLALFALLVLPPTYPAFAGTGLETSFVGLLVLLTGLAQHLWAPRTGLVKWLAGVPPLLAVLTRLDAGIACAASALVLVITEPRSATALRARLRPAIGPTAIGLAVYLLWKLHYYGDILPNTYYAKAADVASFALGIEYLFGFVRSCPVTLLLLALTLFGSLAAPDRRRRAFARYAGIALLAQAIFVAKVGGDFMEYRLMWEYWPVLVAGAAIGAFELLRRSLVVTALVLAASLALAPSSVVLEMEHGMQSVQEMDGIAQRSRLVGVALNTALPLDTVVATRAAGMAFFLPGLRVIDQWGLNDRLVSHSPIPGIRTRGHVKQASRDYLAARGVNLEFGHPMLCSCSNPCKQSKPNVFIRLGSGDECVRSRYLTPTAELTRYFCSHPERFVLHLVDCPETTDAGQAAPATGETQP
jgi:arabinofuranosyltransferase